MHEDILLNDQKTNWQWTGSEWFDRSVTWLRSRAWLVLALSVVLQLGVLTVIMIQQHFLFWFGETVLLKVIPVDPRDWLRGDYVILGYSFSNKSIADIEGLTPNEFYFRRNRYSPNVDDLPVYVTLEPDPDGQHMRAAKVSTRRPDSGLFLAGRYSTRHWRSSVRVGIESFFVPEGTGKQFEDAARSGTLTAEVVVAPWGQAKLKNLRIRNDL